MTDPISRTNSTPNYDSATGLCPDTTDTPAGAATSTEVAATPSDAGTEPAPELQSAASDNAVVQLTSKYKPNVTEFLTNQAGNHSERVEAQVASGPTATSGANESLGIDYAEASVTSGQLSNRTGSIELVSIYGQVGNQNEVGLTSVRTQVGGDNHAALEVGKFEVHAGTHNPDGSQGFNFGASGTIVGVEVQTSDGANSVTTGVSGGPSAEVSAGTRDADADSNTEYCVRVASGPVLLGACFEPGGWLDAMRWPSP